MWRIVAIMYIQISVLVNNFPSLINSNRPRDNLTSNKRDNELRSIDSLSALPWEHIDCAKLSRIRVCLRVEALGKIYYMLFEIKY